MGPQRRLAQSIVDMGLPLLLLNPGGVEMMVMVDRLIASVLFNT